MMDKNKENFGSRFLYAEDLLHGGEFKTVEVVIDRYFKEGELSSEDKKPIRKPVIGFQGKDKLLVLCKTNVSLLHYITGEDDPQKWIGKTVTLQPRVVDAFGEKCVAIRCIPKAGTMIRPGLVKRLGTKAVWSA